MRRLLLCCVAATLASACATGKANIKLLSSPSESVIWDAAEKAIKKKDWIAAQQYLRRVVDAFPQGQHQAEARLTSADVYFDQGGTANYILAASGYREFLTLYPQHAKSDYAQFRIGESYLKQKNGPDRDQTATVEALTEYNRLLDVYPQSSYVEKTRARIQECRQILARGNFLVASFYQRARKAWRAAIGRYELILSQYPEYEQTDEVLFRVSQCLAAAGRYKEALPHLGRLEKEYPKSRFLPNARRLASSFPSEKPQVSPQARPATKPSVPPEALATTPEQRIPGAGTSSGSPPPPAVEPVTPGEPPPSR